MRLRKDSKPYQILKYAFLAGGFIVLSSIAPASGAQLVRDLVRIYFRKKRFEREKFLRDLKNLQARNLINYQELANGDIKIVLTRAGKTIELKYNLDNLKLDTKRKWDKKWRMVIFDIPNAKKKAREALRQKLNQLNFYPIQESVFLTPYECEKELDFICSVFEIRKYVLIFNISNFEGEEKFKHYFKI
ncbi:MAG: hypothetical protein HYY86_01415 [Candidatus Harrisonbacteria bacterium]|nr:hypothetical protein [Candidatus Harrisonbacteria bacterium]